MGWFNHRPDLEKSIDPNPSKWVQECESMHIE